MDPKAHQTELNNPQQVQLILQSVSFNGKTPNQKQLNHLLSSEYPFIKSILMRESGIVELHFDNMDDLIDFNLGKEISMHVHKVHGLNVKCEFSSANNPLSLDEASQRFKPKHKLPILKNITSIEKEISSDGEELLERDYQPQPIEEEEEFQPEQESEDPSEPRLLKTLGEGVIWTSFFLGGLMLIKKMMK